MGEATGHWHMAFFVLTHCQMVNMIYITNANGRVF